MNSQLVQKLREFGGWVQHRYKLFLITTILNILLISWWTDHAAENGPHFVWPITELLGGSLLANLSLLWAPLIAPPEEKKQSIWRRLGRLPDPIIALLAASMMLMWAFAAFLFVGGLFGLVRS